MLNQVDVLVVGGGINGVGIARDAAGRGLSVLLCEKDDLASHTSSASTKLIHGGLRYLEYYEFSLVRKALMEREVLLRSAPHIISPLRFVMPHVAHLRPAWMIRLGLFLYDNLSRRNILFGSRGINFKSHVSGQPLKDQFTKGFVYSDAWVDDARLVVLNALDASELGATVMTRTRLVSARPDGGSWLAQLVNEREEPITVRARSIVNATGPWVSSLLADQVQPSLAKAHHAIRLVQGSHIVTQKLFDHHYAYIFQNPDKRIIFAIPYMDQYTMIGTTDNEYAGDLNAVHISDQEIRYLCESINSYFKQSISPADVVWSFSGVRPLAGDETSDNPSAVTRDYHLELDNVDGALMLSVFGGKITTFRRLAEEALNKLAPLLGNQQPEWTSKATLPGGDMPRANFDAFLIDFQHRHPWLLSGLAIRYAQQYGERVSVLLDGVHSMAELGEELSPGLYEQEARYLVRYEWARAADDILWRRTKLGLAATPASTQRLQTWINQQS